MSRHRARTPDFSIQNELEDQPLIPDGQIQPPRDHYNLSYLAMVVFGLAALLPWNMFITATSYFDKKFESGSPFVHKQFENFITIFSQITNVAFLFINVSLQNRFSAFVRIMGSLLVMCLMFVMTTILVKIDTHTWADGFFGLTLVTVVLFNACAGVFQGGIFGLAASFTPRHIQGFMTGQGVGGIFASVASIISLAVTNGEDPIQSGFYYFLAASLVIIVALVMYPIFLNLPISKFYLDRVTDELSRSFKAPTVSSWTIIKKIKWMLFSVWATFCVTLTVFPAVIASIKSVSADSALTTTYFTPVTCFLLFNFGDFVGRTVAGSVQVLTRKWIVILTITRIIFIPMFAMCNYHPDERSTAVWFDNDAFPIAFMTVFSFSNGYLASLAMMYGPSQVPSDQQTTAGAFMAFGLGLGLMSGAFMSFALNAVL